ncbi:MAG TPA: glycosyltransferase family 2 protein [Terriglobia bacterium]|nr:glycosyltransferase family 2 protein [Terriglobia bacterium]
MKTEADSQSLPAAGGIDLLVVFHDSRRTLDAFLASLGHISIPVSAYFLDNASQDGTFQELRDWRNRKTPFSFPRTLMSSDRNLGFAAGVNRLARQGNGEYLFLLNPDAELEPQCLERLLGAALANPGAGICEARQAPREHPKAVDPLTAETTWCSGAAALIRRKAFEEVGGFDERLYFMYCEDVDLSWKLWLRGWRCLYVPEAVVRHWTQDLTPGKSRRLENYFSFRNSLFLYHRFGRPEDRRLIWRFLKSRFFSRRYSVRSKLLFAIALADYIRYIPVLVKDRGQWKNRHPWVRLEETSLSRE